MKDTQFSTCNLLGFSIYYFQSHKKGVMCMVHLNSNPVVDVDDLIFGGDDQVIYSER